MAAVVGGPGTADRLAGPDPGDAVVDELIDRLIED